MIIDAYRWGTLALTRMGNALMNNGTNVEDV
jgi:hypothetical protein